MSEKTAELREAIASVQASLDCSPVEDPELATVLAAAEAWAGLQWIDPREMTNGMFLGRLIDEDDPEHQEPIFDLDEMDDRNREMGWAVEKFDRVLPLDALPALPGGDANG